MSCLFIVNNSIPINPQFSTNSSSSFGKLSLQARGVSFRYTIARNPKKEICRNLNYITQELEEVQGTYSCDKDEGTKSELRSCVKVEVDVLGSHPK